MASSDWVKCHSALRKGAKRAISRASRFVFLEVCLEARDLQGIVELRSDIEPAEALADLLGGDAEEIRQALADLDAARMVRVENRDGSTFLVIPSWDLWNRPDTSTERVKKHRDKHQVAAPANDETPCNVSQRFIETNVNALEERRGEKRREEQEGRVSVTRVKAKRTMKPAPETNPVSVLLTDNASLVLPADPLSVAASALEVARMAKRSDTEAEEGMGYALEGLARKYGADGVADPVPYLLGIFSPLMATGGLEAAREKRKPREMAATGSDRRTWQQIAADERSERNSGSLRIPGDR